MEIQVKKPYKTEFINPLHLKKGDEVVLGEEEKKEQWKGWIWATFNNISGWIPKPIVKNISDNRGVILDNYSAKELDVDVGDRIYILKELNGWFWVRHSKTNEEGWIPKEITE